MLYDLFCFCNLANDWTAAERGVGNVNANYCLMSWWGMGTLQRAPVILCTLFTFPPELSFK